MSKGDEMQDIAVAVIYGDAEIRPLFSAQTGDSISEIGERDAHADLFLKKLCGTELRTF
jgi:hypothetical protein